jgi:hypothetical protein
MPILGVNFYWGNNMQAVENTAQSAKQTDEVVSYLIRRFNELKQLRSPWELLWQEVRKYVLPRYQDFTGKNENSGKKQGPEVFDSTAPLALEHFAAALDSMLTPRSQLWHGLKATHPAFNELPEVKAWFEAVVNILFQQRYCASANFASQQQETYLSLGAFGTAVLLIEEAKGGNFCYRHIPLAQTYLAENAEGNIDTLFRVFSLTARQAAAQWDIKLLPEIIRRCSFEQPERVFTFLHCVLPQQEIRPGSQAYASVYLALEEKAIISQGMYRTFPYIVSRYITMPGEIYGRSPAMTVLADIKMLNEMEKTQLQAIHQQVAPPLLVPDDGIFRSVILAPGAINYGGIDAGGTPLIQALHTGSRPDINETKMEQKRRVIQEAFLVTLFQILVDNPQMTATEVLQRAQEKGALVAPIIGRQQAESLGPLIERELDILAEQQILPPLPPVLLEANAKFDIMYDSPVNRLQKAYQAQGILHMLQALSPFIEIDPTVLDMFDVHEIALQMAEIYGVPSSMLRSKEDIAYQKNLRREEQVINEVVDKTPQIADTLKTLSEIQPPIL